MKISEIDLIRYIEKNLPKGKLDLVDKEVSNNSLLQKKKKDYENTIKALQNFVKELDKKKYPRKIRNSKANIILFETFFNKRILNQKPTEELITKMAK